MSNPLENQNGGCQDLLNELESLAVSDQSAMKVDTLLQRVSTQAREHARSCDRCRETLDDFALTRKALRALAEPVQEASPWFAARVMAAIAGQEKEIEERREGVWINVRRLAPRLVALCAILLVIGSTWAVQLRRADRARQLQTWAAAETLFEPTPSVPLNDDVMTNAGESRP